MNRIIIDIVPKRIPSSRNTQEYVWRDTNVSVGCSEGTHQNAAVIKAGFNRLGQYTCLHGNLYICHQVSALDIERLTEMFISFLIAISLIVLIKSCKSQVLISLLIGDNLFKHHMLATHSSGPPWDPLRKFQ